MHGTFRKILIPVSAALLLFASCKKDTATGPSANSTPAPHVNQGERNLYVVCEGSLGNGNASLSVKNLTNGTTYDNVYETINGKSLGDVFQSITRIGDRLLLCINNSDKILVIDAITRDYIGRIDVPKPRYIQVINETKAYVSSLFGNKLYIINPQQLTLEGSIEMPARNPEGMLAWGNFIYVCTWDTACNKVYLVNKLNDQIADSIALAGVAPHKVFADRDGFIWVLSGNVPQNKWAAFTRIRPDTRESVSAYNFKELQDPIKPVMNGSRDWIYFIGVDYNGYSKYNGVFRMGIDDASVPGTPLIPAQNLQYFWALGIDPQTNDIYVGDPKGFIQKGTVSVYDASGNQKQTFNVGVGPGDFYFDE
ncbi:MAG: hypothetical protein H6551_13105 [Chitinophagales bacterium]|nr:hypothetical protein [Chitinophagaceae bacterium]MCB9066071.1 hypothetical protein [Chitinophagales bacterium]